MIHDRRPRRGQLLLPRAAISNELELDRDSDGEEMEWYVLYCLLSESKNGKREASMNPNERRLGERERGREGGLRPLVVEAHCGNLLDIDDGKGTRPAER